MRARTRRPRRLLHLVTALLLLAKAAAGYSVDDLIAQLQVIAPAAPPQRPSAASTTSTPTGESTQQAKTAAPTTNRSAAIAAGEASHAARAALNPQHPFRAALRKAAAAEDAAAAAARDAAPAARVRAPPFRREAVVVGEEELEYDPAAGADYNKAPPPPLRPPPPAAALLSKPCTLVNWPGAPLAGGPRCLDHFGLRLPIASKIATPSQSAWSCAQWHVDLPSIRSGKHSRLCLTRVDSRWPDGPAPPNDDGRGVVARPCTLPLSPRQRWRSTAASSTDKGALRFHPARRRPGEAFDSELCLTAHADPCRSLVSTSAELAPCAASGDAVQRAAQSWMQALSGSDSQGRGDIRVRIASRLVRSTRVRDVLERCRVDRTHAFEAIAQRRHRGAIQILANEANPAMPRLLVDGFHRLCLQPLVRLSGAVEMGLHRCAGIGFDPHRLLSSHNKWHGIGAAVRWVYDVNNPASQYGRFVLANATHDAKRGGEREKLCLTCIACTRENLRAHRERVKLTIAPCIALTRGAKDSGAAEALPGLGSAAAMQLWEYDVGSRHRSHHLGAADLLGATWVGAHSLRPRSAREWCVTAPSNDELPYGVAVTLERCRCAAPRQAWSGLRQNIEEHVPSASRTEAVPDETRSRFGKHTRRVDALIAHTVPRKWLAFRDFSDVYEAVPVPYLEWLARGARVAAHSNERAAAHVDAFTVASMQRNTTRTFTKVFVMALFIPSPVSSATEDLYGPVVEVDLKYAAFATSLAALFRTGAVDELRENTFYKRYVAPMIACVQFIQERLPEWGVRIYLAPELASIVPDILAVGNVEVALMKTSSIRTAGTFWRWLAFDDETLDFVVAIDSDEADGAAGGTVLGGLWRAAMEWQREGPTTGHAIMRWYTGWTAGVRAENSHGIQYSPIQANVVMCKPKLLTWSVQDSIIGFGLARLLNLWERRFHPHGETRSHMFSRIFDYDPVAVDRDGSIDDLWAANLGWGRRLWEYGFDEAWTKHVLYHRAVAEGMLFSVIPVRYLEAELPTDLLAHLGGVVDESADALRCANAWFLDGIQSARFPGNTIVATASSDRCSSFNAAAFVAPCREIRAAATSAGEAASAASSAWSGSHHQRWEVTARGCIVPKLVGEEANECLTVPLASDRVSRRVLYGACDVACFTLPMDGDSDVNDETSPHLKRQQFALRVDGETVVPWGAARSEARWSGQLIFTDFDSAGRTACLTADYYAHQESTPSAASPLSLQPCSGDDGDDDETQHWHYDRAHRRLEVRFDGAGANGTPRRTCLAFPSCGVAVLDTRTLRGECDSRAFTKRAAAEAVRDGPSAPGAPGKRWTVAANQAKGATDLLIPQPGSHDDGEEENAQAAADALRKWFEITGVRSAQHVARMHFHEVRSTFFNVVTVSSAAGLLRPWSDEANAWFSFIPVQLMVALVRRIEKQRTYCIAEMASLLVEREPSATRDALGAKITGWFQRPIKAQTLFFRRAAIEVIVGNMTAGSAERSERERELGQLSLPSFVSAVQDFYDGTDRNVALHISIHTLAERGTIATQRRLRHGVGAMRTDDEEEAPLWSMERVPHGRFGAADPAHNADATGIASTGAVLLEWSALIAVISIGVFVCRFGVKIDRAGIRLRGDSPVLRRRKPVVAARQRGSRHGSRAAHSRGRARLRHTTQNRAPAASAPRNAPRIAVPPLTVTRAVLFTSAWAAALVLVGTCFYSTTVLLSRRGIGDHGAALTASQSASERDWLSSDDGVEASWGADEYDEDDGEGATGGVDVGDEGDAADGDEEEHGVGFINPGVMASSRGSNSSAIRFRYVRYTGCVNGDIGEAYSNLRAMIADAVLLARVLVLPRPCLAAKASEYLPCLASFGCVDAPRWSDYLDLAHATVRLHRSGRETLAARLHFRWEDEFLTSGEGASISHADTLQTTWRAVVPKHAREQWRLVIRDMSGVPLGHFAQRAQRLPLGITVAIVTPPSTRVAHIADALREWIGVGYAAVHVRRRYFLPLKRYARGGTACPPDTSLEEDTSPASIARILGALLLASVPPPPGAEKPTVFVVSDEEDINFFAPLREWFTLREAHTMPQLEHIAKADPTLLYEVEKRVFDEASWRLHTFAHPESGAGAETVLTQCVLSDVRHMKGHLAHSGE